MISPATDVELHDWLRWADENGSSFLKATAEAALLAVVGVAETSLKVSICNAKVPVTVTINN